MTGRVSEGEAGFTIEFGRPTVGVRFRDIEVVTRALAESGVVFESQNPVTHLMTTPTTGEIQSDVLDEKILSAIVEFKAEIGRVPEILRIVTETAKTTETVISIGVSTRCDGEGKNELEKTLDEHGFPFWRGKTNLGLGRRPALEQENDL